MFKKFHKILFLYFSYNSIICLFAVWSLGLLMGVLSAVTAGDSFILLMRSASFCRVSIVGLFVSAFLPFLLSACMVFIRKPKVLYIICFLKAILLAQCSFALSLSFGSADWLMCLLYQFTDLITVPFLCWFCLKHISASGASLQRDLLICTGAWLVAASIDYCLVSPFLVMLIDI